MMRVREPNKPELDRFWQRVNRSEQGCWNWIGRTYNTYGYFSPKYKVQYRAHRYSWALHYGPIPTGLWVLHKCDNRLCVRPDHLFLGTVQDNQTDMARKKRAIRREQHHWAKLTQEIADEIRAVRQTTGLTHRELADLFSVGGATISRVCARVPFGGWA